MNKQFELRLIFTVHFHFSSTFFLFVIFCCLLSFLKREKIEKKSYLFNFVVFVYSLLFFENKTKKKKKGIK